MSLGDVIDLDMKMESHSMEQKRLDALCEARMKTLSKT